MIKFFLCSKNNSTFHKRKKKPYARLYFSNYLIFILTYKLVKSNKNK